MPERLSVVGEIEVSDPQAVSCSRRHEWQRREFLKWAAASPLALGLASGCRTTPRYSQAAVTNVLQLEAWARDNLDEHTFAFLRDGADDGVTLQANREGYADLQIRARRLRDVREVDTGVELLGEKLRSPILLAPMGGQGTWHPSAESAAAAAATALGHRMIVSTVSSDSVEEVSAAARPERVWFQLYPTVDRGVTRELLQRAEQQDCRVVLLTVDVPVLGNRERQVQVLANITQRGHQHLGNFRHLTAMPPLADAGLTWKFIDWLRDHTSMKIVIKGIVTAEDAALCVAHGVDGLVVSNHGGRQEESGRGTVECLPEVVAAVQRRIPVLIDGGIRRGTDVFKAGALGADAVCVGRPCGWGLAALGQPGVELALRLLQEELVRILQLAGVTSWGRLDGQAITRR